MTRQEKQRMCYELVGRMMVAQRLVGCKEVEGCSREIYKQFCAMQSARGMGDKVLADRREATYLVPYVELRRTRWEVTTPLWSLSLTKRAGEAQKGKKIGRLDRARRVSCACLQGVDID